MVRRLLDSVRPESVHSVVSCSFRELQLRGSSASPPPWHVPHLLESGAVAVAKAAPDGGVSMARKQPPRSVRAYLTATNNTKATAQQTRRDICNCGDQHAPPSQTLWRWCPCRRRRSQTLWRSCTRRRRRRRSRGRCLVLDLAAAAAAAALRRPRNTRWRPRNTSCSLTACRACRLSCCTIRSA